MNNKHVCTALIAMGAMSCSAMADLISYNALVPLQSTNFTTSLSVPKFDPALGTLDQVDFILSGHVEGEAKFESLDAEAATVEMELGASITIQRPDTTTLIVSLPSALTSDLVSAFDGTIDFGGTSGKTYPMLSADDIEMTSTSAAPDLALFTGLGNIDLPVEALGESTGSGAGNLLLVFMTLAAADFTVEYTFTPIPEPATAALALLGGFGLFGRCRKRRFAQWVE